MTSNELIKKFNEEFGTGEWPDKFEVDTETYANCCQAIFDWAYKDEGSLLSDWEKFKVFRISLGPSKGLMFKNVELILRRNEKESNK